MKNSKIICVICFELLILTQSYEYSFAQNDHFEGRVIYSITTQQRENNSSGLENLIINNTTDIQEHIYQFKYPYILMSSRREEIGVRKKYLVDLQNKKIYQFIYQKDKEGITSAPKVKSYIMYPVKKDYKIEKLDKTERINNYPCQMYKITHTNQEGHLLTQFAWYSDWQPFLIQFPNQLAASSDDIPTFVEDIKGFPVKIDTPMYFSPMANYVKNPYDCLGLVMTLKEVETEEYSDDVFKLPYKSKE